MMNYYNEDALHGNGRQAFCVRFQKEGVAGIYALVNI